MGVTFVVKCLEMLLGRIGFPFDLEIFNYYRRFSIQLYLGLLLSCVLILFYLITDRDWVLVGAGWLTWLEILVQVVDVCLTEAFLAGSAWCLADFDWFLLEWITLRIDVTLRPVVAVITHWRREVVRWLLLEVWMLTLAIVITEASCSLHLSEVSLVWISISVLITGQRTHLNKRTICQFAILLKSHACFGLFIVHHKSLVVRVFVEIGDLLACIISIWRRQERWMLVVVLP